MADVLASRAAFVFAASFEEYPDPICGLTLLTRAIAALDRAGCEVSVVGASPDQRAVVEREAGRMPTLPRVLWTESRKSASAGSVADDAGRINVGRAVPATSANRGRHSRPYVGRSEPIDGIVVVQGPVLLGRGLGDVFDRADRESAGIWEIPLDSPLSKGEAFPDSFCLYMTGRPAREAALHLSSGTFDFSMPTAAAQPLAIGDALAVHVSDATLATTLREAVFSQATKKSDSWMARQDRRLSTWVSRRLVERDVTPNHVTGVATAIGLVGAAALGFGTYATQLVGSLLLTVSIIVDGCDGEIARVKFMESELGRRLDFFLDNVVNVSAIFLAGAGVYWQSGQALYLNLASINAAFAAAAVVPVYRLFFRTPVHESHGHPPAAQGGTARDSSLPTKGGARACATKPRRSRGRFARATREDPPATPSHDDPLDKLVEGIAGRDFAYVLLGLALFGQLRLFTPLCFAGLIVFLLAVATLTVRRWVAART